MSVLLAILTYPAGSPALLRHWPWFLKQEADWYRIITTTDGQCITPQGVTIAPIGEDRYIEAGHLPNRLLNTIEEMLQLPWRVLSVCEYDVLIIKPMPLEQLKTVAAYYAGGPTWESKAQWFGHNPWNFSRECAMEFLRVGRKLISEGVCPDRGRGAPSTPECSPDVFFALCCDEAGIPVQFDLYREYSRNDLSLPEHLEEARQAFLDGYEILHGVKTEAQLRYITEGKK